MDVVQRLRQIFFENRALQVRRVALAIGQQHAPNRIEVFRDFLAGVLFAAAHHELARQNGPPAGFVRIA